jgi:hypothetical protein
MDNTYKLAIFQPTGNVSQSLFKLGNTYPIDSEDGIHAILDDHVNHLIAGYRDYLQYEGTLHYALYQRKPNSQAFDIIEEDTHVLQYPLF